MQSSNRRTEIKNVLINSGYEIVKETDNGIEAIRKLVDPASTANNNQDSDLYFKIRIPL